MTLLHHIFTYLFVLGVVVTLHEMGHYIACKMQGINVDTFSLGFGPILAKATLWDTLFTLRLIPLGGFIKPSGIDKRPETSKKGDYFSKPWYSRLIVVYAGPIMNFVLAFFIFAGLLHFKGTPTYSTSSIIGEIALDSPAGQAGLNVGDKILSINGEATPTWELIRHTVAMTENPNLSVNVERKGHLLHFYVSLNAKTSWKLGILPLVVVIPQSITSASRESTRICTFQISETYRILSKKLSHGEKTPLAGPIGIYQAVAQVSSDWVEVFSLMAIISLSLGIFNLLPIPLLDGGSAMLFWWEGLTGKYPSTLIINIFQLIGVAILGFIFLFATVGDISRLLHA